MMKTSHTHSPQCYDTTAFARSHPRYVGEAPEQQCIQPLHLNPSNPNIQNTVHSCTQITTKDIH